VTSSRRFKLNDEGKIILLTISASQDGIDEKELEGTELKLPEPEVRSVRPGRYWAGLSG
jgi:hypothetical protein